MKILITSPLRQDPKIFAEHKASLDALIRPEGVQTDYFWLVNNCPEIVPYLNEGEYAVADTPDISYRKDEKDHKWTLQNMGFMATLRTMCMYQALQGFYDYIFFVDTDIILKPDTLLRLLQADKDIVCECMWTKYEDGGEWPNAWDFDQFGFRQGSFELWKEPGLYKVGMAGAVTLIKRRVIESGVTYKLIPNIMTAVRGEDRHFCIRAAAMGFEIWLDTHCPPIHLYRESEYEAFMREKAKA